MNIHFTSYNIFCLVRISFFPFCALFQIFPVSTIKNPSLTFHISSVVAYCFVSLQSNRYHPTANQPKRSRVKKTNIFKNYL